MIRKCLAVVMTTLALCSTRRFCLTSALVLNHPLPRSFSRSFSKSMSTESSTAESPLDVAANLASVQQRIQAASQEAGRPGSSVTLVAVSKTKPLELLQEVYNQGHLVFGENYVQELISKAQDMPEDVQWHFIGTLQSNKVNSLVKNVPNLTIQTVSSLKLATKIDNALSDGKKLNIFVQVNTSAEESKGGVEPDQVVALCREIVETCPNLHLQGLMTIGAVGNVGCFDVLVQCRNDVADALQLPHDLGLSMGMSGDFRQAILKGATHVRVGSTIFGERDYSNTK